MKSLSPENYVVRPFVTHKTQTFSFTFSGSNNPQQVSIDEAVRPPALGQWPFSMATSPVNADGIYKETLYESVQELFYGSHSIWSSGPTFDKKFYPSGSIFYVVNIANVSFGEQIAPRSFRLAAASSTASLYDDGMGRIVSNIFPSGVVGNIFYSLGVAVIAQSAAPFTASAISHQGVFLNTGSLVTIAFDATHTIYEHQVVCTMEPGEFNYSINPSMTATSSSVSGSGRMIDMVASGTLTPYMTTVGLYNDLGQLVALGKFPKPVRRAVGTQQTVVIRFDM